MIQRHTRGIIEFGLHGRPHGVGHAGQEDQAEIDQPSLLSEAGDGFIGHVAHLLLAAESGWYDLKSTRVPSICR